MMEWWNIGYKNGNYLISDFLGSVHLVHPEKERVKLLDSTADDVLAADIDFITEINLLLIPTFFDNRIVAYKLYEK